MIADLAVASTGDGRVLWYENSGGAEPTFFEHVVSVTAPGVRDVELVDIDLDGHLDVLVASFDDGTVAWYKNDGTSTPDFTRHVVTGDRAGAVAVAAADLDMNGHVDIIVASSSDDSIYWYRSDGESPPMFTEHPIAESVFGVAAIDVGDLDGDMFPDLAVAATVENSVSRFMTSETDEMELEFSESVLTNTFLDASTVRILDVDGDGDLDIVAGSTGLSDLIWFRNDGGDPVVFTRQTIATFAPLPRSIDGGDIDGDGDTDLVAGLHYSINWYAASDEICANFDVDGDGRIDGVELAWLGRAFGSSSATPSAEWWFAVDFDGNGIVDGDDLAILGSSGVFGRTTTDCFFICLP